MLLASSFVFAWVAQAQSVDTDIYFADAKAGSNHYEVHADHSIDSTSSLTLQGLFIESHLKISFDKDKPVTLDFQESMKQGDKVLRSGKEIVKDGKASVSTNTDTEPRQVDVELSWPMFANFHPQVSQDLFKSIKWDQRVKQKISGFIVEALRPFDLEITPTDTSKIVTADGTVVVKKADVAIGTTKLIMAFTDKGDYIGMDVPSQKLRMVRRGYEAAFADPLAKFTELSPAKYEPKSVVIDIPMRDGVVTKATAIEPTEAGKYPVILSRTPYNRKMSLDEGSHYAKRGYIYIVQDVRGTGESKGKFDPMVNECKDGYDTIDWISKQDWCDGNIGMIGASYGGFVQWAAAVEQHPALKCIVPQVSPPSSAMWNLPYENGVFTLLSDLWWLRLVDNPEGQNLLGAMSDITNMKALETLPLDKADDKLLGFNSPIFSTWLQRDTSTKWSGWNFDNLMPKVTIPALHISGWYDGDEIGTQRNWRFVVDGGNKNQWLIYGPWTHFFNTTSKLGDMDFGPDAIIELDSLYLRWFDTWLKHKDVSLNKVPRVRYFVTNENKWRTSSAWPPAESKPETLAFQFGKVNTGPKSEAKLVTKVKKTTMANSTYDPAKDKIKIESLEVNPTGGDVYIKDSKITKDQIFLRSEPFKEDRVITGPATVEFDFKSSAPDTSFFAIAFDDDPAKGNFFVFRPGKIKASYIGGLDKQRFLTPGKVYHAKLQLWDGANLFRKGHRLTVMILQSEFPGVARNLGTKEPIATGTKMSVQKNVIISDAKHPAFIRFYSAKA
ncbi:MAG: CocE/NonD family hydrolase [Armatimonadetes bacterium]|nr:CocE/NonD family hydrolase [Armatimonadota bacterium]